MFNEILLIVIKVQAELLLVMKFISGGFAVWQFSVASALQSTVIRIGQNRCGLVD